MKELPDAELMVSLTDLLFCSFDAAFVLDSSDYIVELNQSMCRLLLREEAEIRGQPLSLLLMALDRNSTGIDFLPTHNELWGTPERWVRHDGTSVDVLIRNLGIPSSGRRLYLVHNHTPAKLKADIAEQNSKILLEAGKIARVGGWYVDALTHHKVWSGELCRIMELPDKPTPFAAVETFQFYSMPSRGIVQAAFKALCQHGTPYDLLLDVTTHGGRSLTIREIGRATVVNGDVTAIFGIVQDMTEQVTVARCVLKNGDEQRAKLGADLHDGLGQELTGLSLMLKALYTKASRESSTLASELANILDLTNAAIGNLRDLAHDMLPTGLRELGFADLLDRVCVTASNSLGVAVEVDIQGDTDYFPTGDIADHIMRIAQETISNAVKHGHATELSLSVRATESETSLTIVDNGHGIDLARSHSGMGLRIMRYRARLLGGSFDIHGLQPQGTEVRCVLPAFRALR